MAASPVIRVRVTPEMLAEIESAAASEKKTPSDIVRQCVTKALKLKGFAAVRQPGKPKNPE
jgi:hypothetical protein